MKSRQIIALVLLFVLALNLLPVSAPAQVGDPFEITFGQPNIWSLEQAHYLLAQMRERSLRIKAENLKNLNPNSADASRINLIRQLFGLTGEFTQRPSFAPVPSSSQLDATPSPSPTPVPSPPAFPAAVTEPNPFANTVLSALVGDADFLKKLNSDSKLNATTQLDNHVQLQYEIIAKQLTLLRDEVGSDERLVFLELPQSIYSSGTDTKGKVVQTYWEIAGYSEFDRRNYFFAGLEKLQKLYTQMQENINRTRQYSDFPAYQAQWDALQAKKTAVENAANVQCANTDTQCIQNRQNQLETPKKELEAQTKIFNDFIIRNVRFANYQRKIESLDEIGKQLIKLAAQEGDEIFKEAENTAKETIERMNQNGSIPNNDIIDRIVDPKNGGDKIKSAGFGQTPVVMQNGGALANSRLRAVDIIPRQSSLNVNDIQETVKSSILGGAFSFLFGLGLRTNFQRQRDTFEQYLHQEIYASGFGKGENTFGWTFGPVPGTKRVASGVRTTYAVLVVPRKAEALILNARGCAFSRKKFQPRRVMDPADADAYKADPNDREWYDDDVRECSSKKQFILPIPNGGDRSGFWLTEFDYAPAEKGQKVVASIKGRNFTSQVGVLVNGVPLQQVVELTRKLPSDDLIEEYCEGGICGQYEVIDAQEITLAFRMPKEFEGVPNITVIGPGRSVNLKEVTIKITAHGTGFNDKSDACEQCKITEKRIPFMFGVKSSEKLTLSELFVFPNTALLSGTKFSPHDDIYVNGEKILTKEFIAPNQYKLSVDLKGKDTATVLVKQCQKKTIEQNGKEKIETVPCTDPNVDKDSIATPVKTFPVIATQFNITNVTPVRYDSDARELFVRIEGSGFEGVKLVKINDVPVPLLPPVVVPLPPLMEALSGSAIIPVSSREILVKIINPDSFVKITLRNPNGVELSTTAIRPVDIDTIEQ